MSNDFDDSVTKGAHHVGLTVPNLDEARRFFTDLLACKDVGSVPEYPPVLLSDGITTITLWQAVDPARAVPFDRKNVIGLHHLALSVDGDEELDALHSRLIATPNVSVEVSREPLFGEPTRHKMCEIPRGIRVEFIAA